MGAKVNIQYENHYYHCGVQWNDAWECMCNDECPVCKAEIEPYASTELETGDLVVHSQAVYDEAEED